MELYVSCWLSVSLNGQPRLSVAWCSTSRPHTPCYWLLQGLASEASSSRACAEAVTLGEFHSLSDSGSLSQVRRVFAVFLWPASTSYLATIGNFCLGIIDRVEEPAVKAKWRVQAGLHCWYPVHRARLAKKAWYNDQGIERVVGDATLDQ